MTNYQPCFYRVSIKGVIEIDGKIVLTREHGSKRWDLPGGGVEHHEDPVEAFAREIEEELQLKVVHFDDSNMQAWFTYDTDPGWDRPILYLVAFASVAGMPRDSNADIEVRLFSVSDLPSVPLEKHIERFRAKLIALASKKRQV